MAIQYPSAAVKALGLRGNAMVKALGYSLPKPKPAPKAPSSRGLSPRWNGPELGPDTVQQIDVPSAGGITYQPAQAQPVDPAIAKMLALASRSRGEAQAQADAKRKQAALEYGSGEGVPGVDPATAAAAAANPFSILKQLEKQYGTGTQNLEEGLNKANLFYSGYRGQQLGEAANQYQQQKYDAGTRFQATQSDISSALADALLNADMMEIQAGGGGGGDNGAGLVGRPGEWADLPVVQGWDPSRNSDAVYDMSMATPVPGGFVGPQGQRYDEKGRVA